jgi:rSAM/selenodomain-associated transferase 2
MSPLRLSVVIPTLNEEPFLPACLRSVQESLPSAEVIVVDGGSRDRTVQLARGYGARVISSRPSRGAQCRVGAEHTTGDVLFFLHADTQLTSGAEERIRTFFGTPSNQVGTLRVIYPPKTVLHRLAGLGSRIDSYITSTGDQGILVRRDLYDRVGGIPDQPLFEDVEFFQRVRRHARVRSIDVGLHVSLRRFEKRGFMGQLAFNVLLSAQYAMGASPDELARKYRASEKVG